MQENEDISAGKTPTFLHNNLPPQSYGATGTAGSMVEKAWETNVGKGGQGCPHFSELLLLVTVPTGLYSASLYNNMKDLVPGDAHAVFSSCVPVPFFLFHHVSQLASSYFQLKGAFNVLSERWDISAVGKERIDQHSTNQDLQCCIPSDHLAAGQKCVLA